MKITDVRALSHSDFPNVLHLEIETDEGVVGLGETYYFASTVAHFIKDFVAPNIVGKNPLAREEISRILTTYVGYNGSGVETRARSAVDIALWDIAGKVAGKPIYELLGGSPRSVPIYNTCAGKEYMRRSDQSSQSWGIDSSSTDLEDLKAFMTDAGTLAEELISEGISGMKIWPFDLFAEKNWGSEISLSDLRTGLKPISEIRDRVGSKMKIMVELHALWSPA
ncbi:MAG: hypothetical protein ACO3QV_08085, partial [Candidatus Nanopelagicaceae bacterium]